MQITIGFVCSGVLSHLPVAAEEPRIAQHAKTKAIRCFPDAWNRRDMTHSVNASPAMPISRATALALTPVREEVLAPATALLLMAAVPGLLLLRRRRTTEGH